MRAEQGHTLVELLVVAALLSVVVAAAAAFLPTGLRLTARDAARVDALDRAGAGLARLQADVRQARELASPGPDRLDLRLLERVPGAPAVERWVRWDCSARPACVRTGEGSPAGRIEGLAADAEPVLVLEPAAAGGRAVVAVRLPVVAQPGRPPVVLRAVVSPRACPPGARCE